VGIKSGFPDSGLQPVCPVQKKQEVSASGLLSSGSCPVCL